MSSPLDKLTKALAAGQFDPKQWTVGGSSTIKTYQRDLQVQGEDVTLTVHFSPDAYQEGGPDYRALLTFREPRRGQRITLFDGNSYRNADSALDANRIKIGSKQHTIATMETADGRILDIAEGLSLRNQFPLVLGKSASGTQIQNAPDLTPAQLERGATILMGQEHGAHLYPKAIAQALHETEKKDHIGKPPSEELYFLLQTASPTQLAQFLATHGPDVQARAIVVLDTFRSADLFRATAIYSKTHDMGGLEAAYAQAEQIRERSMFITGQQPAPRESAIYRYYALRAISTNHTENTTGPHYSGVVEIGGDPNTLLMVQGRRSKLPAFIKKQLQP